MGRMLAESKSRRARGGGLAVIALACVGGSLLGCRKEGSLVFRGAPVVLISVDTLRADHLPAYGYRGVETPNLDAFRKDSVLFENAYSHVPLTLPSHASLFTGLLPPQNGVRDNLGYALSSGPPTLADYPIILRESKGPITDLRPSALYARACSQGWPDTCAQAGQ